VANLRVEEKQQAPTGRLETASHKEQAMMSEGLFSVCTPDSIKGQTA
jgi:hypothetical protein